MNKFKPDYAIHPGMYLDEIIESRNISKVEFAKRLGVKPAYISHIISGKKSLGPDMAVKFERVLGVASSIWVNMSANYKLFIAKQRDHEEIGSQIEWIKEFPISWLIKQGVLPRTTDRSEQLVGLLELFSVPTPGDWDRYYKEMCVAYRRSDVFEHNLKVSMSWLRVAELRAGCVDTVEYNRTEFTDALSEIRALTLKPVSEFELQMKELCKKAGVALVFVPEPKGLHVYGATKWLNPKKPMIVLSLRQKSDDHFWFSFFHEAGHILKHGKQQVFIDDKNLSEDRQEVEANAFARNLLVSKKDYRSFVAKGQFHKKDIKAFARIQGIAPGVIVGFLQHDRHIEYSWHNGLKERFEFIKK